MVCTKILTVVTLIAIACNALPYVPSTHIGIPLLKNKGSKDGTSDSYGFLTTGLSSGGSSNSGSLSKDGNDGSNEGYTDSANGVINGNKNNKGTNVLSGTNKSNENKGNIIQSAIGGMSGLERKSGDNTNSDVNIKLNTPDNAHGDKISPDGNEVKGTLNTILGATGGTHSLNNQISGLINFGSTTSSIPDKNGNVISTIQSAKDKNLGTLANTLNNKVNDVTNTIGDVSRNIPGKVEDVTSTVLDATGAVTNDGQNTVSSIAKNQSGCSACTNIVDTIENKASEAVGSSLSGIKNQVPGKAGSVTGVINNVDSNLKDKVSDTVGTLGNTLNNKVNDVTNAIGDVSGNIASKVEDVTNTVLDGSGAVTSDVQSTVLGNTKTSGGQNGCGAGECVVDSLKNKVGEAVGGAVSGITIQAQNKAGSVTGVINDVASNLKDKVSNTLGDVIDSVKNNRLDGNNDDISAISQGVDGLASVTIPKVAKTILNGGGAVTEVTEDVINKLTLHMLQGVGGVIDDKISGLGSFIRKGSTVIIKRLLCELGSDSSIISSINDEYKSYVCGSSYGRDLFNLQGDDPNDRDGLCEHYGVNNARDKVKSIKEKYSKQKGGALNRFEENIITAADIIAKLLENRDYLNIDALPSLELASCLAIGSIGNQIDGKSGSDFVIEIVNHHNEDPKKDKVPCGICKTKQEVLDKISSVNVDPILSKSRQSNEKSDDSASQSNDNNQGNEFSYNESNQSYDEQRNNLDNNSSENSQDDSLAESQDHLYENNQSESDEIEETESYSNQDNYFNSNKSSKFDSDQSNWMNENESNTDDSQLETSNNINGSGDDDTYSSHSYYSKAPSKDHKPGSKKSCGCKHL